MLQRRASRRLSPTLDVIIGISAALYFVCTVLMVPAMAQIDLLMLTRRTLWSEPMLFLLVLELVYSTVGTVLMIAWLVWYSFVIDWARGRGVSVPGNLAAVAFWFVPFVNLVHPVVTLRQIATGTAVKTPVAWWWGLFIASMVVTSAGATRLLHGGYDPVFVVGSGLELVAVYLCWQIVHDFRLADQAWDPAQALSLRDAQNESTSATPS